MKSIVFFWDTMRADHASCYGYPRKTTPHLDQLAEDAFVFDNATSVTGHTGPTFTSFVTGQYPFTHDVISTFFNHPNWRDNGLDDTTPVLAEELRNKHGVLTAAFDNLMTWPSHPEWMVRGNDYYVCTVHPENPFCCWVLAEQINARLIPFLEAHHDRDFLIFVHYWDPHQPYNQAEPYRTCHTGGPALPERQDRQGRGYIPTWGWVDGLTDEHRERIDLYDGDITYCDHEFGKVVQRLKDLDIYGDTTVLVTSDHGEDMYEHNAPLEHRETYRSTVSVPFVLKPASGLGLPKAGRSDALVSTIDIAATVFDAFGFDAPSTMDGSSLLPLLRGEIEKVHDELFSTGVTTPQNGFWRAAEVAVRTLTHKLILRGQAVLEPGHTALNVSALGAPPFRRERARPLSDRFDFHNSHPRVELYDLTRDPYEVDNLVGDEPDLAAKLEARVRSHLARNPKRWVEWGR